MDQQSIICTVCPMGCQIHVAGEEIGRASCRERVSMFV